ncbi:transposase domain-containing protein, partial [Streptomyces ipomoeae]|uniref:transposase domain-containing protein n=1 Tax=Streptomyces ipomoeae TaxID=103232 RepID=UPI0029B5D507
MVDEALAQTGRVQARVRDLPSRVVVYLLLAGCLFPGQGWRQVWQRLTAGLDGLPVADPTGGALAQARRRVGACAPALAVRPAARPCRWNRHPRGMVAGTAGLRDRRHDDDGARQSGEPGRIHQAPLQQRRFG